MRSFNFFIKLSLLIALLCLVTAPSWAQSSNEQKASNEKKSDDEKKLANDQLAATIGAFNVQDIEGGTYRLGDAWATKPVVLVFIRHFG